MEKKPGSHCAKPDVQAFIFEATRGKVYNKDEIPPLPDTLKLTRGYYKELGLNPKDARRVAEKTVYTLYDGNPEVVNCALDALEALKNQEGIRNRNRV